MGTSTSTTTTITTTIIAGIITIITTIIIIIAGFIITIITTTTITTITMIGIHIERRAARRGNRVRGVQLRYDTGPAITARSTSDRRILLSAPDCPSAAEVFSPRHEYAGKWRRIRYSTPKSIGCPRTE